MKWFLIIGGICILIIIIFVILTLLSWLMEKYFEWREK